MRRFVRSAFPLVVLLTLAACATTARNTDPYEDPGTAPPATIASPTIATSGSVALVSGDLVAVNVTGFADALGNAITNLTKAAFTVVEDGVVQGITVEAIGGSTTAAADIVFVFDTTASMGGGLTSVKDSIIDFANVLDGRGLDVRFGAVTYGDAFDTVDVGTPWTGATGSTVPPTFDADERPVFPLSADVNAFGSFIAGASPVGGTFNPENAVGALAFAYDAMSWRSGAQRILIIVGDPYAYSHTTYSDDDIVERWIPEDPDALLARLKGNATVHAVTPEYLAGEVPTGYVDMAMFTGVTGTGGIHFPWETLDPPFDLSTLDIAEVAGGYVITFRGDVGGTSHTVRVVIDDGGSVRGEFTVTVTY